MNTRRKLTASLLTAVLLLASGCGDEVLNSYSEYHRLPESGWTYRDIETYAPVHADSLCRGTLVVGIRHSADYPYTSVCVEVEFSDNGNIKHDTVNIPLSDRYGRWLGKGIGASFQTTDTVATLLHASGSEVKIRHMMRCDTLRGINQLGIFFVPDIK